MRAGVYTVSLRPRGIQLGCRRQRQKGVRGQVHNLRCLFRTFCNPCLGTVLTYTSYSSLFLEITVTSPLVDIILSNR